MLFRRFRQIGRAVENAQRYRTIVTVFLKYGFEDLARRLPLPHALSIRFAPGTGGAVATPQVSQPERLRRAFEELGPTFVKFGQLLSSRPHLLPPGFAEELVKLLDQVPPIPFAEVRGVLERELDRPLHSCFITVEETPLGSASIAQVHRAILLTGEQVVLKVQRPAIEPTVRVDLQIMMQLAGLLENHVEGWRVHRPTAVVAQFARQLELELDFEAEAAHVERFARQFADEPALFVPKVYHAFSTRRVLTMDYVGGTKASDQAGLAAAQIDRREVATRIADLVMKQIFVHGFFHADPHPGNIHILPGNVVCFLDFGMMGFLNRPCRETLADFVVGVAQRDEAAVSAALLKLAGMELEPPGPGFEANISEFIHLHFYRPIGEMGFGELLKNLFRLTAQYELTLPPEFIMVLKALSLMEGLVSRLDPEHDLIGQARPFMRQVRLNRLAPRSLYRQWSEVGAEALVFARELPLELRRVLAQIKTGRLKLNFHHEGLEPLDNTLERVSNRLAFALVLSALIVSSSIIIHARVPPQWHGMPVIGLIGYIFAGMMGAWLLLSILRHGKM